MGKYVLRAMPGTARDEMICKLQPRCAGNGLRLNVPPCKAIRGRASTEKRVVGLVLLAIDDVRDETLMNETCGAAICTTKAVGRWSEVRMEVTFRL